MKKDFKRLKKLNNCSGFTLVEMLVTLVIVIMVSTMMAEVVKLGVDQYERSLRSSESKVLCSTISTILTSELSYTQEVHVDSSGNVTKFQSQNFAINNNLSMVDTDGSGTNGYGEIVLANCEDSSEVRNILGTGSYTRGLLAKVTTLTYNSAEHCFHVVLSIGLNGSEYMSYPFDVINVNRTEAITD